MGHGGAGGISSEKGYGNTQRDGGGERGGNTQRDGGGERGGIRSETVGGRGGGNTQRDGGGERGGNTQRDGGGERGGNTQRDGGGERGGNTQRDGGGERGGNTQRDGGGERGGNTQRDGGGERGELAARRGGGGGNKQRGREGGGVKEAARGGRGGNKPPVLGLSTPPLRNSGPRTVPLPIHLSRALPPPLNTSVLILGEHLLSPPSPPLKTYPFHMSPLHLCVLPSLPHALLPPPHSFPPLSLPSLPRSLTLHGGSMRSARPGMHHAHGSPWVAISAKRPGGLWRPANAAMPPAKAASPGARPLAVSRARWR
ncbi:unnamed protein product, partial [Closterium sp. NIES-65]